MILQLRAQNWERMQKYNFTVACIKLGTKCKNLKVFGILPGQKETKTKNKATINYA